MPSKVLLKLMFLSILAASCSAPSGTDLDAAPAPVLGSKLGNFSPLDILPSVLDPYRNDPSWPAFPRRDYQHQAIITKADIGEVSVRTGIPGIIEAGTSLKLSLERRTIISTIIMASNDPEKGETVFDLSQSPSVRLNYWEGRDMIVVCLLSASYSLSEGWNGKLKLSTPGTLLGTGADAVYEKSITNTNVSSVTQTSKMRRPLVGESDLDAIDSCRQFAENPETLASVKNDLDAGLKNVYLHLTGSSCVEDTNCERKFDNVIPSIREWTTPRCIQRPNTNFFCELKGKEGMNCPFYETDKDGKKHLVTSGMFERECDEKAGLVCTLYEKQSLLSAGKAKCLPKKTTAETALTETKAK